MLSYMTNYVSGISNKNLSFIATSVVAVIIVFVLTVLQVGKISMAPLYSDIEFADRNEIVHFLDMWGVEYSTSDDQIFIQDNEIRQVRMRLAAEGLPSTGSLIGYEVFNKSDSLGTSSFTQNVNLVRALEGELARTIMSFNKVSKARVHLVIPKRELFSQNKQKPTASVVLKMRSLGADPSTKEVEAIAHLIASAVAGLNVDDVTIVSTEGKSLKSFGGGVEGLSSSVQEHKMETERRLRDAVEHLVERIIGPDKVRAEVSADIDFDQVVIDSEVYYPDGQVVRSIQTIEEKNETMDGNNINTSVENNTPRVSNSESSVKNRSVSDRVDETRNFEISREKRKQVKAMGMIKKLSVAVLVDGSYGKGNEGEELYIPIPAATLAQLKVLIAPAVGLNIERGDSLEVVNMRFSKTSNDDVEDIWLNDGMYEIIKIGIISLVVFLIALFVVKPSLNRVLDIVNPQPEADNMSVDNEVLNDEIDDNNVSGVDMTLENEMPEEEEEDASVTVERLNKMMRDNPSGAVEMLRLWLSKGENSL